MHKNLHYPALLARSLLISSLLAITVNSASAQTVAEQSTYVSPVDESLTIRKISVLPFSDNVGGIYSRPLEKHVIDLVDKNHHWTLTDANAIGPVLAPEVLEQEPEKVATISRSLNADAFLVSRVSKGPNGITIKLSLFLTTDQKLLATATVRNLSRFEIQELKDQTAGLLSQILGKIPYDGLVLSRQGARVTVNLGRLDGIETGKVVSAVQIIKTTRHPKFNFLINSEKEILGKIKLVKVDDTLSFGRILTEKEKGAIQKNSKISGVDYVTYPETDVLASGAQQDGISQRPDSMITFGQSPKAWRPKRPPTFGQVGAKLGLGMYTGNVQTTSDTLDTKNPYYPSVTLEAELWVTSDWTMHANLRQGIIPVSNPTSGGEPSDLSQSLSAYEFLMGYTFRQGVSVWGPKVELLGGYSTYRLFVDSSSSAGLTTVNYSGLKLGLKGSYPVTLDQTWHAGANLFFFFEPRLSESPTSSGSGSKNTINYIGIFGAKKLGEHLKAVASLDFELYSTQFSSGAASSISQRHTTLSGGIYYLF